jgi:hypothetical protein
VRSLASGITHTWSSVVVFLHINASLHVSLSDFVINLGNRPVIWYHTNETIRIGHPLRRLNIHYGYFDGIKSLMENFNIVIYHVSICIVDR